MGMIRGLCGVLTVAMATVWGQRSASACQPCSYWDGVLRVGLTIPTNGVIVVHFDQWLTDDPCQFAAKHIDLQVTDAQGRAVAGTVQPMLRQSAAQAGEAGAEGVQRGIGGEGPSAAQAGEAGDEGALVELGGGGCSVPARRTGSLTGLLVALGLALGLRVLRTSSPIA